MKVQRINMKKISALKNTASDKTQSEGKIRVAAYCRVSTESEEQMNSIQNQIDYYKQYINNHPDYINAGIYADNGVSGTGLSRRNSFNQLMEDCRSGLIDMIITKSVSRFSRNTVDTLNCIRELRSLNIHVYFEKDNIHTKNKEGELLLTLLAAIAQSESMAQSENVKWGIRRRYVQGLIGSVPLGKFYGYTKNKDGELIINEEEAEIVRLIYKEFLDGYGYYQIASRLTEKGIPTNQKNKTWSWSSVFNILTNEKIKGDTLFQKTYHTDYITKKRRKNTGELAQYYLENSHRGIIDKETWECVQLELARQKKYCEEHHIRSYHWSSEKYPLSARITCSICGCTFMLLESKRVGEEGRKFWRCSSFLGKQGKEIEGKLFTSPPLHRSSTNPNVIKRRKDPKPRQMLCTDIRVEEEEPEKAIITAWNDLVIYYDKYSKEWSKIIYESENALTRYRAKEMIRLVPEVGIIQTINFKLIKKVLNHIEVDIFGNLKVEYFINEG